MQSLAQLMTLDEHALRSLLDDMPVGIGIAQPLQPDGSILPDARILYYNKQWVSMFGFDVDQVRTVGEATARLYPDPTLLAERLRQRDEAIARHRAGSASELTETRAMGADGRWLDVITGTSVVGNRLVVTMLDITTRKEAERKMALALKKLAQALRRSAYELTENMPAGTYVVTLTPRGNGRVDLAFRFASKRFLEMFGIEREAVVKDPNVVLNSIHPDDLDGMNEANARAYSTNQPFRWEGRLVIGGRTRWYNISSNPRIEADGVTVWEGVVTDITARIEAEQRLAEALEEERRQRARAEQAYKAKSLFLANVSHEIRTPLSALVSFAQAMWLESGKYQLPQEFTRFLESVRSGGNHLNLILTNLLDVSAAESGRLPIKAEEFYLRDWTDDLCNILEPMASSHLIRLTWHLPEDEDMRWHTDPMRLTQILLNLAHNAIKFSGGEHREVAIEINCSPSGITLSVSDQGPGIPAERLPGLFGAFEQGEITAPANDRGVGLGLAIVRQNCEMLGGKVTAQNLPTGGMRFMVSLPGSICC